MAEPPAPGTTPHPKDSPEHGHPATRAPDGPAYPGPADPADSADHRPEAPGAVPGAADPQPGYGPTAQPAASQAPTGTGGVAYEATPVPGHPAYQVSVPPAYPVDEPEPRGRGRGAVAVAVTAAIVAVAAAAGVGALVLGRDAEPPQGAPSPTPAAPTASGPPPGDLRLRDDLTTITLTWTDPSGGVVPFMVAGGRAGQSLGVMASVDPGSTSYTVNGLNSRVDYCFTVLAVWSTDTFATSGQVCTEREGRTPSS